MRLKPMLFSTFVWLSTTLFLSAIAAVSVPHAHEPQKLLMYITICLVSNVIAVIYVLCTALDSNRRRPYDNSNLKK